MVLDEGKLMEFDKPETLLAREDSLFSTLVRNAAKAGHSLAAGENLSPLNEEEEEA
jgi:hypothetical protein